MASTATAGTVDPYSMALLLSAVLLRADLKADSAAIPDSMVLRRAVAATSMAAVVQFAVVAQSTVEVDSTAEAIGSRSLVG
jgi:hypothetical protein